MSRENPKKSAETPAGRPLHPEGGPEPHPPQVAPQEEVASQKKVSERPHWTTFVAPSVSVLVAALSLFTTWYVFRTSAEANRNVVRPFVTLFYVQNTSGGLFRSGDGATDKVGALGTVTLTNVGNTPAYDVTTEFTSSLWQSKLTCTGLIKGTLVLPHSFKTYPIVCDGSDPKFKSDVEGTAYIFGRISYHDVNGFVFGEPIQVGLCIGQLDGPFCKANIPRLQQ